MHVLLVVSWYKTDLKPYIGSFFEEQARSLMKRGIQVGILYPEIDLRIASRFQKKTPPKDFVDNNIVTIYHHKKSILPRSRRINYYYLSLSAQTAIDKYIREKGRPDILHAHSVFSGGIVAAYLSSKYKIPYVLTEHFTGLILDNVLKIKYNIQILKKVFDNSSANICVSSSFAADLSDKISAERNLFRVIPNLVNDIFFENASEKRVYPFPVFFTNSFLTAKKNHKLILESFSIVLKRHSGAILYIGGDGVLKDSLVSYCRELNISENVIFLGGLGRSQVKKYLDISDIYLSASLYETFGISIAEALACGKPVVSTDSGGPRDIIDKENGILVKDNSSDMFSKAIFQLIDNYKHYNGSVIREKCRLKFSEQVVAGELINLYEEVLQR